MISTPEEIAAWLAGEIDHGGGRALWPSSTPRQKEVKLLIRRTLVRLCPEVRDYAELVRAREKAGVGFVPPGWFETVSDEEAVAHVERGIAKLWEEPLAALRPKPD